MRALASTAVAGLQRPRLEALLGGRVSVLKIEGRSVRMRWWGDVDGGLSSRRWLSSSSGKMVCSAADLSEEEIDAIPREKMRKFSIIAHVDHGKSTLADRLLEKAGNVQLGGERQLLDDLKVERERGITVKARTATMFFDGYLINLIDTPGHVDFETEVKRSLASCQGALLLIDSSQGVQAQSLANHNSALDVGLKIIPVLTKLDLPHSDPANALEQIERVFGYPEDDVLWTSAKTGEGCEDILPAVVSRMPAPGDPMLDPGTANVLENAKFRGKVVDSWYDKYRGTICLIALDHGVLKKDDKIVFQASCGKSTFNVTELGLLLPNPTSRRKLRAGMVGYVVSGIRDRAVVQVGDWVGPSDYVVASSTRLDLVNENDDDETALRKKRGHFTNTPKVFASVFPVDTGDFEELQKAMDRLTLNDAGVVCKLETSGALGAGFRCGFLGRLHMEVFFQRLTDEFETQIIATAPSVPYKAVLKNGEVLLAESPAQLPDYGDPHVSHYLEPMAEVTLLTPVEYMGVMMELFTSRRARQKELTHLDNAQVVIKYTMPWQEVIIDLHDAVKGATSGFASFDYEEGAWEESNVAKVSMLINGNTVDALTFVTHRSAAEGRGRKVAQKLKKEIKRQQFEVIIQAAIGARPIARERIPPVRKDVLVKSGKVVGGGDMSRKKKLLQKQKEGKKRLKSVGNVQLSQKAFMSVLERD